jgi:hypothetical protein
MAGVMAAYGLPKVQGESIFCLFFNAKGAKYAKKIRNLSVLGVLRGSFYDFGNAMAAG